MAVLQSFSPLILGFHLVICVFLIVVILLQAGKGADMGATFGAGGSQSLFGPRGAATFLSKMTTVAAILFLLTSIVLANFHRNTSSPSGQKSVVEGVTPTPAPTPVPAPTTPAPVEPVVPAPAPETSGQ